MEVIALRSRKQRIAARPVLLTFQHVAARRLCVGDMKMCNSIRHPGHFAVNACHCPPPCSDMTNTNRVLLAQSFGTLVSHENVIHGLLATLLVTSFVNAGCVLIGCNLGKYVCHLLKTSLPVFLLLFSSVVYHTVIRQIATHWNLFMVLVHHF